MASLSWLDGSDAILAVSLNFLLKEWRKFLWGQVMQRIHDQYHAIIASSARRFVRSLVTVKNVGPNVINALVDTRQPEQVQLPLRKRSHCQLGNMQPKAGLRQWSGSFFQ